MNRVGIASFVALTLAAGAQAAAASSTKKSLIQATVCEVADRMSKASGWSYTVDGNVSCDSKREWFASPTSPDQQFSFQLQKAGYLLVERKSGTIITERPRVLDETIAKVDDACRKEVASKPSAQTRGKGRVAPAFRWAPAMTLSLQHEGEGTFGWATVTPANAERSPWVACVLKRLPTELSWPTPAEGKEVLHFAWQPGQMAYGAMGGTLGRGKKAKSEARDKNKRAKKKRAK